MLRAGLWEKRIDNDSLLMLRDNSSINWQIIYRLAEEQSVIGLITSGLDYFTEIKAPQEVVLQFVGTSLQTEQRNLAMNQFIAITVDKMREEGICTVLVKGQGIAQCYKRPLWRSCGDIDFFFSRFDYSKAVQVFSTFNNARIVENARYTKSLGIVVDQWFIELHGTLRNGLSSKMDRVIDEVQDDIFLSRRVRVWNNGKTAVLLPDINDDVFLVFVHFVRHFYKEGVCLRQICDWCRLLWSFIDKIDIELLKTRLQRAALMEEWKAFATVAVHYLGMPVDAMPLYDEGNKWSKKADKIVSFIFKGVKTSRIKDTITVFKVFPISTLHFLPGILLNVNWLKIRERVFGK